MEIPTYNIYCYACDQLRKKKHLYFNINHFSVHSGLNGKVQNCFTVDDYDRLMCESTTETNMCRKTNGFAKQVLCGSLTNDSGLWFASVVLCLFFVSSLCHNLLAIFVVLCSRLFYIWHTQTATTIYLT